MSPLLPLLLAQVPSQLSGYAWVHAPWGNNGGYYATRARVEREYAQKRDGAALIARWRSFFDDTTLPPETRFGYPAALVVVAVQQGQTQGRQNDVLRAARFLASAKVPANYETARARYLLEHSVWPAHQTWPLVKRLLAREPDDYMVRYYGSGDLACGAPDLKTRLEGLAIAEELAKEADRYPRRLRALGAANEGVWRMNKDPTRLKAAINAWRRLLARLAPNDGTRPTVEATIQMLEGERRKG